MIAVAGIIRPAPGRETRPVVIYVSTNMAAGSRIAASYGPMDPKDSFMRFVVIGSILAVGVFALFVTLRY